MLGPEGKRLQEDYVILNTQIASRTRFYVNFRFCQHTEYEICLFEGAWLVAQEEEQRRRFKAVLSGNQTRTYSQIREERKKSEKTGKRISFPQLPQEEEDDEKTLDGFFLVILLPAVFTKLNK